MPVHHETRCDFAAAAADEPAGRRALRLGDCGVPGHEAENVSQERFQSAWQDDEAKCFPQNDEKVSRGAVRVF